MKPRNPPRAPRTKPKGGRPCKADAPTPAPVSAAGPYGVDPALVDPLRILAGIAANTAAPAPARVAACKVLLRFGPASRPEPGTVGRNAARDTPEDVLKPVTAKNHMLALKQIEDFAVKRKWASKSITHDVLKEVGYARKGTIRTFQLEDVQRLVGLAENLHVVVQRQTSNRRGYLMLKAAVQLAAFCGLRMGEIWGLTVESIDLKAGVLKIRHSLTQLDELKGPKTAAGNRDVPLPARVQETLEAWLATYYIANPRRLVFRMACGKMVSPRNFRSNYWVPLLKRAGLHDNPSDTMHFHALRHFAASLMIDLGLPLTDVASLMGHEKFDMTLQVYAHPIVGGNRRREAFERISSALSRDESSDSATFVPKPLIEHARPIATGRW